MVAAVALEIPDVRRAVHPDATLGLEHEVRIAFRATPCGAGVATVERDDHPFGIHCSLFSSPIEAWAQSGSSDAHASITAPSSVRIPTPSERHVALDADGHAASIRAEPEMEDAIAVVVRAVLHPHLQLYCLELARGYRNRFVLDHSHEGRTSTRIVVPVEGIGRIREEAERAPEMRSTRARRAGDQLVTTPDVPCAPSQR